MSKPAPSPLRKRVTTTAQIAETTTGAKVASE